MFYSCTHFLPPSHDHPQNPSTGSASLQQFCMSLKKWKSQNVVEMCWKSPIHTHRLFFHMLVSAHMHLDAFFRYSPSIYGDRQPTVASASELLAHRHREKATQALRQYMSFHSTRPRSASSPTDSTMELPGESCAIPRVFVLRIRSENFE